MSASKGVSGVEYEEVGTRRVPTPRVPKTECEPLVPGSVDVKLTGPSPRVAGELYTRVGHTKSTPDGPPHLIPVDSDDDNSSNDNVDDDNNKQEEDAADAR